MAAALGAAHAGVSLYWLAGGTAMLTTLGDDLEASARGRSSGALATLAVATIVKLGVVALGAIIGGIGPLAARTPWRHRRTTRLAGWATAVVLVAYGGVKTIVGVIVVLGIVDVHVEQPDALRWHAYFWDPWFLLWGVALSIVMARTRPESRRRTPRRFHEDTESA